MLFLSLSLFLTCVPKINYLKVYENIIDDINQRQEMNFCSAYFYSEKIKELQDVIYKTDKLELKNQAQKIKDSLESIHFIFKKHNIDSYCFETKTQFNEFKRADSILESKNLSFCKIVEKYNFFNEAAWVLAKEKYPKNHNQQADYWEKEYEKAVKTYNKNNKIGSFEKLVLEFYGINICQ